MKISVNIGWISTVLVLFLHMDKAHFSFSSTVPKFEDRAETLFFVLLRLSLHNPGELYIVNK